MKVILLKDVKGQGKRHDIIEVKDGYGNNFLIKNGYGVLATEDSVKRLKKDVKTEEDNENRLISLAEENKAKLAKITLSFSLKTGAGDKVFGSVSPKQIAAALKEKGFEVDKKKIMLDEAITCLGFSNVKIELHKKVIAEVRIETKKA
ncbi:MAG: 50S ribosomal protein L9 [Bacilli bacterium]|nr:50S ribosomal protein L9 [Bacilli bacterium]